MTFAPGGISSRGRFFGALSFVNPGNKIAAGGEGRRLGGPLTGLLIGVIGSAVLSTAAAGETLNECLAKDRSGDAAAAMRCFEPLAKAGDAEAEFQLGMSYGGLNAPVHDPRKSEFWLKKAAEQGAIDAQVMLGDLYRQGEGVPKDLTEAVKWYRLAADRGDQMAEFELARMYFEGWGVPRDVGQAIAWERKAADQEGPLRTVAELSMATAYFKGVGVPQDYGEAARWFRRAAEHGSPTAYLTLAQLDEKGLGGPPDLFEAYVGYSISLSWLQARASPAKITDVVAKHRDDVAAKLTPEEKTKANDFVRQHKGDVR